MSPEQVQILRRLARNDRETMNSVMTGQLAESFVLHARVDALVRITALLSIDSDPATFRWAAELGLASGLEDDEIFQAVLVVAPIIGTARLTATLPLLMSALDLDIIED